VAGTDTSGCWTSAGPGYMLQLLTLNPGAPAGVMLNRDATPKPATSSALPESMSRRCDRNFSSRLHFARRLENHTFQFHSVECFTNPLTCHLLPDTTRERVLF